MTYNVISQYLNNRYFSTAGFSINNALYAWGNNSIGQLGENDTTNRSSPVQVGPNTDPVYWTSISAGGVQAIAIQSNGTLWAWGLNSQGQLGTNNLVNYSSPIQVGALSTWTRIAGGGQFTLAIQSNGTLWSWGNNTYGQLGLSDTTNRSSPVQVGALSVWTRIAAGGYHSIAIQSNGTLWSWGFNGTGQLGLSNLTNRSSPVQVGSLSTWTQVFCGYYSTFAIQTPGTLWAWGYNDFGQLGLNTTAPCLSPVQVGTLSVWTQVSCGYRNTAAIQSNGTLWSWGFNVQGQLGLSDITNRSSPVQVGALSVWTQVSCGYRNTAAIQSNGTLWSWGSNSFGQLGLNDQTNRSSPVQVVGSSIWTQVSSSNIFQFTLAIQSNGTLWSWGFNGSGQLGLSNTTNRSSPVQVAVTPTLFTQISCGYNYFSLGIQSPGTLWSWGSNSFGQLGVNTSGTNNTSNPVQIPFPVFQGWSEVAINAWGNNVYALAIQSNGTLWAWGNNTFGQLGLGDITNRSSPVQVGTSSNWIAVTTAQGDSPFSLAVQSTGTLWSWGSNNNGALGLNSSPGPGRVSTPVQVGTASTWSKISAGNAHWLGIQNNGTLWGCGYNVLGQLGNNSNIQVSSPIQIGASLWSQISAGGNNGSMGIQSNGSLWGWGTGNGQYLGLNTSGAAPSSPVQVGALTSWVQINFYGSGGSAIQSNGTLWAWGFNFNGQLGLNDTATRSSPVQVGSLSVWARIACGYSTIAVQSNGTLWAWGNNSNGMLGLNTSTASYSSPVQVGTLSNWLKPFVSQRNAYRSAAINNTGRLFISGESGLSAIGSTSSPVQLVGPLASLYSVSNWTQIAAANAHWLAIQSPGTLWSCGYNGSGQLGNNTSSTTVGASTPIQVGLLSSWSQVAGGNFSSYALQNTGTLWAWGYNVQGQLGQGNTINYSSPVQVGALSVWRQIAVNSTSATALALQSAGTLWAWGFNGFGQIGNSNINNQSSPVQIGALTTWTKIASGGYSSYALQSNGTLWAWGLNSQGQLGLNTTVGVSSPVQVGTTSNWIQIGAGALQLAAMQNNGTLWMCGYNAQGQLGNNSTTNISSLVQVGSLNKWNFATGARHILAQQIL